ncbi:acyl-CoA dehydrogenase family protein [Sporosarcina luteola]|uniref:acyl-CoA dehydrogenase family protein n=1 Tax=Sporosarcina luteola TaxID=582850 RepID=UPI00203F5F49|nr:acyl-CoA dehydrogenase family protein [Sporosarcina luteola]MCM3636875.1 acyl-CoA dehydrogenase family protein [Sporosarcina luteola]
MAYQLTDEQVMIKETLVKFLEKEIAPMVEEYERNEKPVTKEIVQKLVPFGFLGGLLPEEAGGHGLDYTTYFTMIEELSRVWPSLRATVGISNSVLTHIYEYGTEEQKEKHLGPLLRGEKLGFFALTEPNVGSDASSVEMRAELKDEKWILNGTKIFITNGLEGEIGIVIAQTDKTLGNKGIAALLIDKEETSFLATKIEKMGTVSCPFAELVFENSEVPAENVLGNVGEGLKQGLKFLNSARAMVAYIATGISQACLDASIKYVKERHQFGKPIGSFQLIQEKISEMITLTNAMRLLGQQASSLLDQGKDAKVECSMAKYFATDRVLRVAEEALQIHGGYGYTKEFPVERYYRDIRYFTIAEGTNEMQKLIIGREVLGISAFV